MTGASIVVEFIKGKAQIYDDLNDGGITGFGVMTNEASGLLGVWRAQHCLPTPG